MRYLLTVFAGLLCLSSFGSHIRGAEITIERIGLSSELKFRFTVTALREIGSEIEFGQGVFDFGDGVSTDQNFSVESILLSGYSDLELNVFQIEHTYASVGNFTVSYVEENRNSQVLNISNAGNTPFYIESQLKIDPAFGINNSPIFTVFPMDKAAKGVRFLHNPGAIDPDGDSLSYELIIPKQGNGLEVFAYSFPNDTAFYDNYITGSEYKDDVPTFDIDPITGMLSWNAPGNSGEYTIAFKIKEWRKIEENWFEIGFVTRDMEITVEDTDNNRPKIHFTSGKCIVEGDTLSVTVEDTDGDDVLVSGEGEVFDGLFEMQDSILIEPISMNLDFLLEEIDVSTLKNKKYNLLFKVVDLMSS